MTQTIKSGDTAITFSATLEKVDSAEPWDLVGATVYFVIRRKNDTVAFIEEADVISATDKTVEYTINPADDFPTDTGEYSQEWKVVFSDNTILRFPNDTYNKFNIKANLED